MQRSFACSLILATLGLALIPTSVIAQPHVPAQRCLGGSGDDGFPTIIPTRNGGYMVITMTSSNDDDAAGNHRGTTQCASDLWVIKLNGDGRMVWWRCLGGIRFEGPAFLHRPVPGRCGGRGDLP